MEVEGQSFIVQESWARIATLSRTYYAMAADAYEQYLTETINRLPDPGDDHDPSAYMAQDERLTVCGIQTIVFSAMALEAAAFDFAAIQLGDEMAKEHLDKLDLLAKWVIVPQLVCGRSLRTDGPALNDVRALIKARNRLVHHKSQPWPSTESVWDDMEKRSTRFRQEIGLAIKTVILLSLELEMLLGTSAGVLPSFDKDRKDFNQSINPQPEKRPLLAKVIAECRAIHRKNFALEKA